MHRTDWRLDRSEWGLQRSEEVIPTRRDDAALWAALGAERGVTPKVAKTDREIELEARIASLEEENRNLLGVIDKLKLQITQLIDRLR